MSRRECARPALRSSARQLAISRFGDAGPGTVFMSPRVVAPTISCAPGGHGVPDVRFPKCGNDVVASGDVMFFVRACVSVEQAQLTGA